MNTGEDKWFTTLAHTTISKYYGMCKAEWPDAFELVEGRLVKWAFVDEDIQTPWCLRLRMVTNRVTNRRELLMPSLNLHVASAHENNNFLLMQ